VIAWIACWSESWFAVFLHPQVLLGEYVAFAAFPARLLAAAAAAALACAFGSLAKSGSLA
jgi:hypothetical protein